MKKILSALAAALLGCTALCTPVLAAETEGPVYQMGDVNMDGRVDCCDALLALQQYVETLAYNYGPLTRQQIELADVEKKVPRSIQFHKVFTGDAEQITRLEDVIGVTITDTADGDYGDYEIYTASDGSRYITFTYQERVTAIDAQDILMYYVHYVLLYPDGEMTILEYIEEYYPTPESEWE